MSMILACLFRRLSIITVCVLSLGISQAGAAVTLNIQNGVLMGASGVNVSGVNYDVAFRDGTCNFLFGNCSAFTFNSAASAASASQSLLDQVFLDSAYGNFDSSPSLTNGCTDRMSCYTFTPFNAPSNSPFHFELYLAANLSSGTDQITLATSAKANDVTNNSAATFAVWSVSAVPEPSAFILFGLGGLILMRVQRKRYGSDHSRLQ